MRHAPGKMVHADLGKKTVTLPAGAVHHPRLDLSAIDLLSQFSRAFKGDHLTLPQDQVGTGGRISAPSLRLLLHAELAEPGHEDIVAALEGSLDNLKQGFDGFNGLFFRKAQVIHLCDNIVLGQCHCASRKKWLPVAGY
jgi:hypothetical protein